MPQTVEHLQIVDLLGLERGMVAVTKADLVNDDQMLERMAEVETLLASTALKGAEIVPVSAVTGQGIDELKGRLLALGESGKGTTGFARLAVDRCFVLPGAGVVVTGTVHAGEVQVDDRVLLSPSGLEARVRSLHAQNRPAEVGPPASAARSTSAAAAFEGVGRRGDWVVSPELHAPTDRIDVRLKLLRGRDAAAEAWAPVHVHLGSAHVMGRVALLERRKLAPGATAWRNSCSRRRSARWRATASILRDPSATRTIAGAAVIDPFGPPRNRRTPRRLAELGGARPARRRRCCRNCCALEAGFVDLARFGLARNLRPAEVDRLLAEAGGVKLGGYGFLAETLDGGAPRPRRDAEGLPRDQRRCARPAARAAARGDEEALAGAGLPRAARSRGARPRRSWSTARSAPARPFAEARREGRGAVAEDRRPTSRATASSRRACATSRRSTARPSPTCASCCGGWPSSAASSRWRPTSTSCGPWWPR